MILTCMCVCDSSYKWKPASARFKGMISLTLISEIKLISLSFTWVNHHSFSSVLYLFRLGGRIERTLYWTDTELQRKRRQHSFKLHPWPPPPPALKLKHKTFSVQTSLQCSSLSNTNGDDTAVNLSVMKPVVLQNFKSTTRWKCQTQKRNRTPGKMKTFAQPVDTGLCIIVLFDCTKPSKRQNML